MSTCCLVELDVSPSCIAVVDADIIIPAVVLLDGVVSGGSRHYVRVCAVLLGVCLFRSVLCGVY